MRYGTFWAGILGGLILAAVIGFGILPYLGIFTTTATGKPGILDWWGDINLHNAVERQAPEMKIPPQADLAEGFEHYRNMCLHCHGAPNAGREKWATHMLPKPPKLWEKKFQEKKTDGQLFYIVNHGIRMTGMPAFGPLHGETGVWNMVAFVRRLDELTVEQQRQLQQAAQKFGHQDEKGKEAGNHHSTSEEGHTESDTTTQSSGE